MHEGSAEAVALSLGHDGLWARVRGTQPQAYGLWVRVRVRIKVRGTQPEA